MKKRIVLPIIFSLLGHGIFFSLFINTVVPSKRSPRRTKLYIITSGQIKHKTAENIHLTPLNPALAGHNPLWSDTLYLSGDILHILEKAQIKGPALMPLKRMSLSKKYIYYVRWNILPNKELLPKFSDIFYHILPYKAVNLYKEHLIDLKNNVRLSYYIQGPVSKRALDVSAFPFFNVNTTPVNLRLRFWVSKSGLINQVVIEDGSGFPMIDTRIIDAIRHWSFSPVYEDSVSKYQWGIITVNIQD